MSTGTNNLKSGNGMWAIVAIFFAIIAGVYAMVSPMHLQIEFLERRIASVLLELHQHEAIPSHIGAAAEITGMRVQFSEVETQFRGQRELFGAQLEALEQRVEDQERDGNPRHDERIRSLELVNGIVR